MQKRKGYEHSESSNTYAYHVIQTYQSKQWLDNHKSVTKYLVSVSFV